MRLTRAIYQQLSAAAQASSRTISQEIEARLRLSFEPQQKIIDEFGGPTNYWLLKTIARVIGTTEWLAHHPVRRWWEDPYTFNQVKNAINTLFDFFKPSGRAVTPAAHVAIDEPLGQLLAEREMANIERASMADVRLDGYPSGTTGLPPGTLIGPWPDAAQWFSAAGPLVGKLKTSPLLKLYGMRRKK